jgi:hypothetical protein
MRVAEYFVHAQFLCVMYLLMGDNLNQIVIAMQ